MKLKFKQIYDGLKKIREWSMVAQEHCLTSGYTHDVKMYLRQIIDRAQKILNKMEAEES
jgi:hypothetical protein